MMHVVLSGSPYEVGYQHGQILRVLVDAIVQYELRRHAHVEPLELNKDVVLARVRSVAPAILEEMEGIADGAGLPFERILELNLRVLHYCTVIAFTHSDVGPLLGKNLDFPRYAYQMIFTVQPQEGHVISFVGCVGSVAVYGGVNNAGLAMGQAVVDHEASMEGGDMPIAFLRRLSLQHCATVPEAIAFLGEHKVWRAGDNLVFLDQNGAAALVELAPGEQQVFEPIAGAIWRTNFFARPDSVTGTEERHQRYHYLEEVLSVERPPLTRALMHRLLGSHDGESPVCRNDTQLSLVAYPASGRLEVADGRPCQVGYKALADYPILGPV